MNLSPRFHGPAHRRDAGQLLQVEHPRGHQEPAGVRGATRRARLRRPRGPRRSPAIPIRSTVDGCVASSPRSSPAGRGRRGPRMTPRSNVMNGSGASVRRRLNVSARFSICRDSRPRDRGRQRGDAEAARSDSAGSVCAVGGREPLRERGAAATPAPPGDQRRECEVAARRGCARATARGRRRAALVACDETTSVSNSTTRLVGPRPLT